MLLPIKEKILDQMGFVGRVWASFFQGLMSYAEPRFYAGSFTRDISSAGDQAVTGVGFRPKAVVVFAAIDATAAASWGFSVGAGNGQLMAANRGGVADNFEPYTYLVLLYTGISDAALAALKSFDPDGFTITWTKSGSPTGTATMKYLAFR